MQDGLLTKRFGRRIYFLREIGSTNDFAKRLATFGAYEGTVVISETQTSGRGRHGRVWHSPAGGLWFSLILRPNIKSSEAIRLMFLAGLAVAKTLRETYGVKAMTKWPNDVTVNGKKICGILTEISTRDETVDFVVVGIGINANFRTTSLPDQLRKSTTSLREELGKKVSLENLFKILHEKTEKMYDDGADSCWVKTIADWKRYSEFIGRPVEVTCHNNVLKGVALNVDDKGALLIQLSDGIRRVVDGDMFVYLS